MYRFIRLLVTYCMFLYRALLCHEVWRYHIFRRTKTASSGIMIAGRGNGSCANVDYWVCLISVIQILGLC